MRIVFLGYDSKKTRLIKFLKKNGHIIKNYKKRFANLNNFDLVISFGFQKKLDSKTIKSLKRPPINLHISYLPYNKGSHPNFWSFINKTIKGVTIHEIDNKIDNGDIIVQKRIHFPKKYNTFKITYKYLIKEIEKLFIDNYKKIISGNYSKIKQGKKGSFHFKSEIPKWKNLWNYKIKDAIIKYKEEKKIINSNYDAICILSKSINYKRELTKLSKERADLGAKLFRVLNKKPIIMVMGWNYKNNCNTYLADLFKNYLIKNHNIPDKKIYLDKRPRDTVGEALFSFIKLSKIKKIKNLCIVTHKSHLKRAKYIFEFIYNNKINIYFECINDNLNEKKILKEKKSLKTFIKTFRGIKKGDISNIIKRILYDHPYYNGQKYKKIKI